MTFQFGLAHPTGPHAHTSLSSLAAKLRWHPTCQDLMVGVEELDDVID
jgi:hypothetical protein